jgi:hypothetical protein
VFPRLQLADGRDLKGENGGPRKGLFMQLNPVGKMLKGIAGKVPLSSLQLWSSEDLLFILISTRKKTLS